MSYARIPSILLLNYTIIITIIDYSASKTRYPDGIRLSHIRDTEVGEFGVSGVEIADLREDLFDEELGNISVEGAVIGVAKEDFRGFREGVALFVGSVAAGEGVEDIADREYAALKEDRVPADAVRIACPI